MDKKIKEDVLLLIDLVLELVEKIENDELIPDDALEGVRDLALSLKERLSGDSQ